jgi:NADP-dependent 3-hydroxy acid dehydrogenase YdfG
MINAVLPGMRARRSGAIVNISTIGVQIMPAGSGYYSASKAALEAMSGALHQARHHQGLGTPHYQHRHGHLNTRITPAFYNTAVSS